MKVTMKEAEKLVPVSRTTLYTDKKNGVFTYSKNERNRTVIDIAELQRVYGELNTEKNKSETVQPNKTEQYSAPTPADPAEVADRKSVV